MKDKRPGGLLVPLTTPFDDVTGEVAPVHLRDNARALLDAGATGLLAAGSTGEASLLDDNEYRNILEWLRDVVPPEKWLIAGAGRESTRGVISACRVAADAGADAALVRPPAYYSPAMSNDALIDHYRMVADDSPIPVMVYNMPKYTHISISDAIVAALADHENIWGAKDSSGDLKNLSSYMEAAPNWTLLVGSGALYYAALELGAAGAIAATACFATKATCEIGLAYSAGDKQGAGSMQERVAPLHAGIVGRLGIAGVKAAMDEAGAYGGPVRAPLKGLAEKQQQEVKELLDQAGI